MIKISTNDSIKALWEHLYSELVEKFDNDLEEYLKQKAEFENKKEEIKFELVESI